MPDKKRATSKQIFSVGKPIPKVWLHMEFDLEDTMKYLNNANIETENEVKRLVDKYSFGCNDCGAIVSSLAFK
jgi:hypothetical protein